MTAIRSRWAWVAPGVLSADHHVYTPLPLSPELKYFEMLLRHHELAIEEYMNVALKYNCFATMTTLTGSKTSKSLAMIGNNGRFSLTRCRYQYRRILVYALYWSALNDTTQS